MDYHLDITVYSSDAVVFALPQEEVTKSMKVSGCNREAFYRMAASQYLRTLFFRENMGCDVGRVFEVRSQSDYHYFEDPELLTLQGYGFVMVGGVTVGSTRLTAPTIIRPSTYQFMPGTVVFVIVDDIEDFSIGYEESAQSPGLPKTQFELNCARTWKNEKTEFQSQIFTRSDRSFRKLDRDEFPDLKTIHKMEVEMTESALNEHEYAVTREMIQNKFENLVEHGGHQGVELDEIESLAEDEDSLSGNNVDELIHEDEHLRGMRDHFPKYEHHEDDDYSGISPLNKNDGLAKSPAEVMTGFERTDI